ncbi:MAG: hypothetical protein ACYCQI_07825 [Gammaproteobacteria bacterium]
MAKARLTFGQKLKNQFINYSKEIADSFHGRATEPSAIGPVHSFVSRNLLIQQPDESEIKLQNIYRAEADTAIKRSKEIDRLIQQHESTQRPKPLDEKSLENLVQAIFDQYYDLYHLLETPRYRGLKAEHRKDIELLEQANTPEAQAKRQIEIKEINSELANLRSLRASASSDLAKNLGILIAEKEQELKKASMDRAQLISDTRAVHQKQEETALKNTAKLVEIALKKHITELHVWRWINQCLQNPHNTLTRYYNDYVKNIDSIDQDHLTRLTDHILKNNPIAELFDKCHAPTTRTAIKSYLKQKVIKQKVRFAAVRNTELSWHYLCPLTEFGAKTTVKEGVKGKVEMKSQPATPRSPRTPDGIRDGDLTPTKKNGLSLDPKGFEAGNTTPRASQLLSIPVAASSHHPISENKEIENKEVRPATPLSPSASPRNSSPSASPATTSSLFKTANEKIEAEYNKLSPLPILSNVVTHNPLRYVSAGLNGVAELVLRKSSRHPALKYTTGLFIGGSLVVVAATTTGAVDFVSFVARSPKTLYRKAKAYKAEKAKKAKNAKEDLPKTPAERTFSKITPLNSPRASEKQIELSVSRPLPVSRSPKPALKALDEPSLPNAVPLSIDVDEKQHDRIIMLAPTPTKSTTGSQLHISKLLARRLQADEDKEISAVPSSHVPAKRKIESTRVHKYHNSIDFRFTHGSKLSLHLEPVSQEQGVLKQRITSIQEDGPLSNGVAFASPPLN